MAGYRPADWHVLDLDKDPTPGDPDRVRQLARTLHDFADDVSDALRLIKGMAQENETLEWAGKTAEVFQDEFSDVPKNLKKLKKSYDLCGDALVDYWPTLERAQALVPRGSGVLRALYGTTSNLRGVRIRSVNLNWRGPTVRLRIDLPSFPVSAPPEWIDAGMDTMQCQFEFLAVENISLTAWDPPAVGDVEMTPVGTERRMWVAVHGLGIALRFECSESVGVSHVSAFKIGPGGSDNGPHLFVSRLDA